MRVINRMSLKPLVCLLEEVGRPPGSGQPSHFLGCPAELLVYADKVREDRKCDSHKGQERPVTAVQHDGGRRVNSLLQSMRLF